MGERLAGGNVAIALLANTIVTGAMLFVLITIFGSISGAHFNPAVSVVAALQRNLTWTLCVAYVAVQLIGALIGVAAAHAMFELPIVQASIRERAGAAQLLSRIRRDVRLDHDRFLQQLGSHRRTWQRRWQATSSRRIGSRHRLHLPIRP